MKMTHFFKRLCTERALFLMGGIQEKHRSAFSLFSHFIKNVNRLTVAGKILEIPLAVSEYYPEKFGKTVKELNINHATCVISTNSFSMLTSRMEKEFRILYDGCLPTNVVLYGLETHACIEQTAYDLLSKKINVFVVADCCISRVNQDRDLAFERLRGAGCVLSSVESIIYELLQDKDHPKIKELSKVLQARSCDMEMSLFFGD